MALACLAPLNTTAKKVASGVVETVPMIRDAVPPDYERCFAAALVPLADYDIFQWLDKLDDRPLLLWHGDADPLVPPAESARLYQTLAARSAHHLVCYLTKPEIGHKITVGAPSRPPSLFFATSFSVVVERRVPAA